MKHLLLPIGLLIASCAIPAYAEINLTLPRSVNLLIVNGQEQTFKSPLVLQDGTNQLVFKYQSSFRQQGQVQPFSSNAIILTFTGANTDYDMSLPRLRSRTDSDNFNKDPKIELSNQSGESIDYIIDVLRKNGLQIGRDYKQEITAYNRTQGPAAITGLPGADTAQLWAALGISSSAQGIITAAVNPASSTESEQQTVSEMLNYWYNKADTNTREQFNTKINAAKKQPRFN